MASEGDSSHRRNQTTPQSIPLQDLSRPPESFETFSGASTHRRTLSERSRRIFSSGPSIRRPDALRANYAPIQGRNQQRSESGSFEDAELSPLAEPDAFQRAVAVSGISFDFDEDNPISPMRASALPNRPYALGTLSGANESMTTIPDFEYDDGAPPYPSADDDNIPLTDATSMQPMAGTDRDSTAGQRHDRLQTPTIRFSAAEPSYLSRRLGDDLDNAEAGVQSPGDGIQRSGSRIRALSPSMAESQLRRAGTVVRKMSQRVVNLSNESEIEHQTVRRRHTKRSDPTEDLLEHREYTSYNHDGNVSPAEKQSPQPSAKDYPQDWVQYANPLKGNSLSFIGPSNFFRTRLCDLLVHPVVEPIILIVILAQAVLLAVDASESVYTSPRTHMWGSRWLDFAFLAIFIVYTVEIGARIVVSGLIINPIEYSTINRAVGFKKALIAKGRTLFALQTERPEPAKDDGFDTANDAASTRFSSYQPVLQSFGGSRQQARVRLAHRAFLRHSFNRLDFLAVISYWISLILAAFGYGSNQHILLFHMMSSLRILRLLSLTSGTSVILRSLKKAAPLLLNVALLIGFFWLLFAIIGVQSFKSSLRRTCVWIDPEGNLPNYTSNAVGNFQFCGGSLSTNGEPLPWYFPDNTTDGRQKGYLCPPNSLCISSNNPYNGTVSFDNIFQSLELVFVVMTSNTYTDLMYYLADSDYLAVALFFASGIVVMTFWLMNLLIAVITTSFQVIREESKRSAFGTQSSGDSESVVGGPEERKRPLARIYDATHWLWIVVITYGLICQCFRSANMSKTRETFISVSETAVTLTLLGEIIIRFIVDWRAFFRSKRNMVDFALAIITTIMQLPVVHDSGRPYAWLTFFQILRIYRVVLAVPWTRDLIVLVLGNVSGLVNLILFVFLLTFFAAIFAAQLFRGEIPPDDSQGNPIHITFATIYNSFLGMYQVLSSENWTILLYNVTNYDSAYNTAWIGALFFILWFTLGFFIVLNMFIAVIQENFDVSEDEKRLQQVKAFLQQKELGTSSNATLSLSAMFKMRQLGGKRQDPLDYGPAMMDQLLKEAVVQDFLDYEGEPAPAPTSSEDLTNAHRLSTLVYTGPFGYIRSKISKLLKPSEPNPFYSRLKFSRAYEDVDPRIMAREVVSAADQRKRAQKEYLVRHPNYNVSLYIFKPDNTIRRLCQQLVGPGRGHERIEGASPSPGVWYAFSAFLYAAIVAMVLLACITTPLYQKEYFKTHGFSVTNWFVFTDMAFAILFTVEGAIRVVADGFFWTPHAYLRSSWGLIDGLVLVTLWINVASQLYNEGAVSRAVGAFKALRALRLLNISDSARDTFHSVIVRGGWKVLSAAFVSLSLLIPFAIYGLNLFNGRLQSCNDNSSGIVDLRNCVMEYNSSPFNWEIVAPRQVDNPWFSFDNFGDSLFILFQIVSQEGWTDVMWAAESITGVFTQPEPYSGQGNAVFFIVFNLLGAVFVLTLFVSVFMRNYTEQTGVAFLTTEQRSWLELRKLLRQISPSKRPTTSNRSSFNDWCYRLVVRKTGRWARFVTVVMTVHLVLLCLEFYPWPSVWESIRNYIFLVLTVFYMANIALRICGLTWTRFRKSAWDLYSLVSVSGTFIITILYLSQPVRNADGSLSNVYTVYQTLHKLFLVSIVLLLIPRNNQLDQLFKTAAASLTAIANLMATWFVLFLVYAIAFTQTFGLTRFNSGETGNINFRTVPKALILLFRMSTGEGWNQLMEDFAAVVPPFCNESQNFLEGDCGSPEWARALFISWNILSMYIFVNMFVSLIFESFSYVYQRSSGLAAISRDEIRRFKQAWAEYDPDGTGYIRPDQFPRLLGEFSGVFDMRIYPPEFSVQTLKEDCQIQNPLSELPVDEYYAKPQEIDLEKLDKKLDRMPLAEIRNRRRNLNVFYEEVLHSADPDRGIAFTSLLMILAHYKVINDSKSLRLEEFLRRRARLQRVEHDVCRSIVSNFLDTVYWSRRFRAHMRHKESGRMTTIPQLQVPEIFVEDEDGLMSPESPTASRNGPRARPALTLQIPGASSTSVGGPAHTSGSDAREPFSWSSSRSASQLRSRSDVSPGAGAAATPGAWGSRPSGTPTRPSFSSDRSRGSLSPVEGDSSPSRRHFQDGLGAPREPHTAAASSRPRSNVTDVLDVLDASAWGQSIRRSMTTARGGANGGGGRGGRAGFRTSDGSVSAGGPRSSGGSGGSWMSGGGGGGGGGGDS